MKPFLNAFRLMYLTQEETMYPDKYMPNGLKPIEAFYSDISNNMVRWAASGDSVYYETKEFWYRFTVERDTRADGDYLGLDGIVWMRRFALDSSEQITYFANKTSIENLGKKWLFDKQDKRVIVE